MKPSRRRHVAKTITYRVLATIDTILLSWFISGDPRIGLKIGFAEVITKMLLYYFHERLWLRADLEDKKLENSRKRHGVKTISWRVVGTLDTMLLAWIISGDPMIGLKIVSLEVVTKMLIYYLHERAWYKFDYGVPERNDTNRLK